MTIHLKVVASNDTPVKVEPVYKFPRGAVVCLNSENPLRIVGMPVPRYMTIQNPGVDWSDCTWFDDMGNRIGPEKFHNDTIQLVPNAQVVAPAKKTRRPRKPPTKTAKTKRKPKGAS